MITIAPIGDPMHTARQMAEAGYEITVSPEGKYLRAYPTTVQVD